MLNMLPANDITYLRASFPQYSVVSEGGMVCAIISDFTLPLGLSVGSADLLLRLSPGYPDVPPDMWWFSPAVRRQDGSTIQATELTEHYLGRQWQRWSRHLTAGQWRSGVDSLESYLALVRRELNAGASKALA
jgi:hypothetical protein